MRRKSSGVKPQEIVDSKLVQYGPEHWKLLQRKREEALNILQKLAKHGVQAILFGSVCRGDVAETSDLDFFVPYKVSSFRLETALLQEKLAIFEKRLVQATPKHVVKGHIYLQEDICITFPLTSMREREFDFIRFGGSLTMEQLEEDKRVAGVDKRLVLIEPTAKGHKEGQVVGFESIVAQKVGVPVGLVKERVRVLTTRDKVGRTGVYLSRELALEENMEEVFKQLRDSDPIVRRRARQ